MRQEEEQADVQVDDHDARRERHHREGRQRRDMMMAGAMTNTGLSANGGIQSSFQKILIMSATTCKQPERPARGSGRSGPATSASSRRSTQISPPAMRQQAEQRCRG